MLEPVSLRSKLIVLITAILVIGFTATSFLNYEVSSNALRTAVMENRLPLSSNTIYSEIQTDLLRPIFVSSMMAQNTFLRDWVVKGEQDPERMIRYLKSVRKRTGAFTAYFISAKTLRYYHFKGISRTLSESDPADSWFFHARDIKEPYDVNVDFNDQQNDSMTVFINYRVLDYNGKFIGVTGVGLDLKTVMQFVKKYQKKFNRRIYFVDKSGLIRIDSVRAKIEKININNVAGLKKIAGRILTAPRGSYTYKTKTDTVLLTTRYLPELKWYLFIEWPQSQAMANMRHGFMRNMIIGPLVILATLFLIIYTINIFQRRLEEMAVTDKLTGLGNRQAFDINLGQALKRFHRDGQPISLILIDIDHFKCVNDTWGHLAGDEAIQKIASIIRTQVRGSDVVCRWGGEEFAVLAYHCTAQMAIELGQKICTAIKQAQILPSQPNCRLTGSAGVAQTRKNDTVASLLTNVDQALYKAKNKGRDRVEMAE